MYSVANAALSRSGLPHSAIRGSRNMCFSPRLFAAYHGLLRLATPRHPPMDPYSLDHIIVPIKSASQGQPDSRSAPAPHAPFPCSCHRSRFAFARSRGLALSAAALLPQDSPLLEIRGFEPLTYGLQSRRSSQLSYIPSFPICNTSLRMLHSIKKGMKKEASDACIRNHTQSRSPFHPQTGCTELFGQTCYSLALEIAPAFSI
jgi:hypothetical protein